MGGIMTGAIGYILDIGSDVPHMSRVQAAILQLLAQRGRMYGMAIVEASRGAIKRGTVYVTLSRMHYRGWVARRGLDYEITEYGRDVLALCDHLATASLPWLG
jgi:DNA-binding PadR family transcriptional regulator